MTILISECSFVLNKISTGLKPTVGKMRVLKNTIICIYTLPSFDQVTLAVTGHVTGCNTSPVSQ